mmetsp:Transcript_32132/g.52974  ORF Transcript_32132/g.52974 Transcript_32132/m.52974 type:complete len:231 (+) Transcript_32132:207-899(+)
MEHAEVGVAHRQLLITADARVEHHEVARTVHGFQHPLLFLHVQAVHVILVVLVVTGLQEEPRVVHVGRHHFLESTQPIFAAHEINEFVVDPRAQRKPKAATRRHHWMEHHEFLLLANIPVVSFCSLFLEFLVLLQELVVGKGDAVQTLQRVQILISQPIGRRILRDHEGLGPVRVGQVRPAAEIHQVATAIATRLCSIGYLVRDQLHLEGILLEKLQRLFLGEHASLEEL